MTTTWGRIAGLATVAVAVVLAACAEEAAVAPQASLPAAEELAPNGRQPFPGIFTGGQPSAEQLRRLSEAGFGTVINLRMPGEPGSEGEAELVSDLGMRYVSIPVDGAAGMTEANARALAEALDEAGRPVMVHCASSNRVGGLFALKRGLLEGAPAEEAMATGLAAGLSRLEPVVRELLESREAGGG